MNEKLTEEERQDYLRAGELASEVREKGVEMVAPGKKILEIAEEIEDGIREGGGEPAFPANISINEKAAHYSPPEDDDTEIEEEDLVKIDVGVHINGYIGDTATTVYAGEGKSEMVQAINQVLENAIDFIEPGVDVGKIGEIIEKATEEKGYSPIKNLTGHNLERWSLHGGISIPNVKEDVGKELEAGDVIALEPFLTDGEGEVEDMPEVYIFRYEGNKGVSGRMALQTLRKIKDNYGKLPFAERWLTKDLSRIRLQMTLRELLASESIHPYYVLKEVDNGQVAQAEHTMIVTEQGCEVTTR
ncbi:hypothetical protein AKJ64_01445 [candidate division MSBL1 archaeon SCGC-AAA259E17]|uniref:Methionine aminopeptidase n=1 Tax=candidate division MSBL1 archaeon SCGC-AAA259E17 TaxID=1698263 RepID=A0A133UG35_9EURY|nr:hypothetical protein AKJ64_01445 [candidate division MSBL1 archaeon SCGC-AAA259E17]